MKLSIVTAVCGGNEVTREWLDTTIARCSEPHELIIVSNGSSIEEGNQLDEWCKELELKGWKTLCHLYEKPFGPAKAFDIGARTASGKIVAMLHNDLEMLDGSWDDTVIDFILYNKIHRDIGVCGFVGAKRLGDPNIYKIPYNLNQLARYDVFSAQDDAELHGRPMRKMIEEVAVLDGMALIIKRDVFEKIGGFDRNYIHHMYDNDLCISAHYAGLENFVINETCHHRGGMTSCASEYGDWAKENYDGDVEIHRQSHEYFYKKWDGKLPVEIR